MVVAKTTQSLSATALEGSSVLPCLPPLLPFLWSLPQGSELTSASLSLSMLPVCEAGGRGRPSPMRSVPNQSWSFLLPGSHCPSMLAQLGQQHIFKVHRSCTGVTCSASIDSSAHARSALSAGLARASFLPARPAGPLVMLSRGAPGADV